jgi:hypothetical protein
MVCDILPRPVRLTNVQHGEDGAAACVDAFTVRIETDAVVLKGTKDFEEVPDAPARQIDRRVDDHQFDPPEFGQQFLPLGVPGSNGRAVIIAVGSNHDAASPLPHVPPCPEQVVAEH